MKKIIPLACILILLSAILPGPALAARGTPDDPYFGYGLHLDVNGARVEESIYWAAKNKLDWIAIDFDWDKTWPDPIKRSENTPFGRAARLADNLGLSLVFSIQNPPEWAMTSSGPDPVSTARLVSDLARLYPGLEAVELYPRANTRAGWGATPNASLYAKVFQTTASELEKQKISLYLLAGGLTNQLTSAQDQTDLVFLQGLYNAGISPQVISVRLESLSGMPGDEPLGTNKLRHFEQIRQVMVANDQSKSLIWITGFEIATEAQKTSPSEQAEWMLQAYRLMRSHLYFGTSFYSCFNAAQANPAPACLIDKDGKEHPFLATLRILIGEN